MTTIRKPRHSLRKAVNEKCKDCIYDSLEPGTWRMQVTSCTSYDCPLYDVRPTSKVDDSSDNDTVTPILSGVVEVGGTEVPVETI